ncbi:MAG: hypothetical protein JNG88_13425 [Phycisphaerales bacterium]|nr:hypothetical protein [Phycisphaerales bacterium]
MSPQTQQSRAFVAAGLRTAAGCLIHARRITALGLPAIAAFTLLGGCPPAPPGEADLPSFANGTDKTNASASYVGSAACKQCHSDIATIYANHSHAHAITTIRGAAPTFPNAAQTGGVPNPPDGFSWANISYVIGGYSKAARFINQNGEFLTTGLTSVLTQWNLPFDPNGANAEFASFLPAATGATPLDFNTFAPRTTGPVRRTDENPLSQDNRPGIEGAWFENGAQCEACHGPGGNHFFTAAGRVVIDRSRIFVDPSGDESCRQCHAYPFGDTSGEIAARDGFIAPLQQASELSASGAHARFSCTTCHDPHHSIVADRGSAIRNECGACHSTQNMAGHRGAVFERGDYRETLTCESCHMPFAVKDASSATAAVAGPAGRIGDTRSHIFRLSVEAADHTAFLTDDGGSVRRDPDGLARITVDYVCLRCHNGQGNVFSLTVARAAEIAGRVHDFPE